MEKRMLYQSLLRLIMAETQTPHKAQNNATIEKNSKRRRKRRRWKLFFVFMRSYKFKAGWCLCVIHARPSTGFNFGDDSDRYILHFSTDFLSQIVLPFIKEEFSVLKVP